MKSTMTTLAAFVVLPMVLVLAVAGSVQADIIHPDLPAGSQYQLIFVTAGKRDATSRFIWEYDTFVSDEAALNPMLPETTWHAVAYTTGGEYAKVNAPSEGLPVYNSQGILVATADTGLYTLSMLSPILYDQFGVAYDPSPESNANVWTGTNWQGLNNSGLGSDTFATVGSAKLTDNGRWAGESNQSVGNQNPLFALSEPITVVPELSSFLLCNIGLFALASLSRRRR